MKAIYQKGISPLKNDKIDGRDNTDLEGNFEKILETQIEIFKIVTTFRYKGRIMKFFNVGKVMALVSVSIHEARISRTFFVDLKVSRR